jgi:hypothetical protein
MTECDFGNSDPILSRCGICSAIYYPEEPGPGSANCADCDRSRVFFGQTLPPSGVLFESKSYPTMHKTRELFSATTYHEMPHAPYSLDSIEKSIDAAWEISRT